MDKLDGKHDIRVVQHIFCPILIIFYFFVKGSSFVSLSWHVANTLWFSLNPCLWTQLCLTLSHFSNACSNNTNKLYVMCAMRNGCCWATNYR